MKEITDATSLHNLIMKYHLFNADGNSLGIYYNNPCGEIALPKPYNPPIVEENEQDKITERLQSKFKIK